jgi:hypothetical protein
MPTTTISTKGAIIISALVLLIYAGAFAVAYMLKSDVMLNVLVGTAATNATTVVGFWVGSSAGSQKKDDTIATMSKVGP